MKSVKRKIIVQNLKFKYVVIVYLVSSILSRVYIVKM